MAEERERLPQSSQAEVNQERALHRMCGSVGSFLISLQGKLYKFTEWRGRGHSDNICISPFPPLSLYLCPPYLLLIPPPPAPHLLQSDFNHHFRQNTLSRCVSGGKTALRTPSITFYLQQWCIAGALLWRLKRICWISIECVWWMTVLAHNKGTSNRPPWEEVRTFTNEKQLHTQTLIHPHTLTNAQMTAQTLRQL